MKKYLLIFIAVFTLIYIVKPIISYGKSDEQTQQAAMGNIDEAAYRNQAVVKNIPSILAKTLYPSAFAANALQRSNLWGNLNEALLNGQFPVAKKHIIVIDAGHGGSETGAVYGGVKEKDLNLDIALRLEALLKKEDVKTYMTRTDDSKVGLYDRSGLANDVGATLFLSIHNNAGNSSEHGSMSLYYPSNDSSYGITRLEFAAIVQKHMNNKLGTAFKGIIERPNLAVLRTTNMPAVLAEVGYMSNQQELNKLKTPEFRQKAAEALRDAILEALKYCK